jgi:cytochrome c oxidase subunit II
MKRLGLLAALALAGCTRFQTPLEPAGAQAASEYRLLWLMLAVCGVMYVAVIALLIWGVRRRHTQEGPAVDPADPGFHRGLAVWAGVIVIGLVILILGSFLTERELASARAHETLLVRVTGHQWWWRVQYRDPASGAWIETANELHLPLGRTTRVVLGSGDVIHSFWVPNVSGKMDVIPGRDNSIDLTPTRSGWFRGQCAEFCGAQHAHMAFDVKVETPAEFAAWLATQGRPAPSPADPVAEHGMQVVTQGPCAACHTIRGTSADGRPGPDLTHVGSRRFLAAGTIANTRGGMQGWIVQPQAIKPGTSMPVVTLSPADADAAARYLEMLK